MLNPNYDRLDYGEILTPKQGYSLDFAVGTTYSLDLDALVGASLALGLSEETDSDLMNNPICLLEALRSTGDKVALFCEGGQIHLPGKVTSLYVLLEKMVFAVKTAKNNAITKYPSFHPKFWLIRYINTDGDVYYRFVVLSRNLTFDRSWDISYYMDGKPTKRIYRKNEALCDFMRYLLAQLPSDTNGKNKAKSFRAMINEIPNIVFELPKEFNDYEFIPNGIRRQNGKYYHFDETDLFNETFHEIVIISPFLSGDIIRDFNTRNDMSPIENSRYMLVTRELSLGKLKPDDCSNFDIYTLRDKVIDGESAISGVVTSAQKQDIHAKVYMIKKYSTTNLYLGSLNASHNAVYGNVEFMLKLSTKNRYLNMDKLKTSLFCGDEDNTDNPFQRVTLNTAIINEEDEKDTDLNAVVKDINRCYSHAVVTKDNEDYYSVDLHIDFSGMPGFTVSIRPLLSQRSAAFSEEVHFEKLTVDQLSEFYVISVSDGDKAIERVLIINTEGIPEDREKMIVSKVVNDKECFYRYVTFLLGDDAIISAIEVGEATDTLGVNQKRPSYHLPALYEKMLQTAATDPEKFKGIEYLIQTISDDGVIPPEFIKLYETFKKAVKLNG